MLTLRKIFRFAAVAVAYPILTAVSFYATIKTFNLARKYFPQTNSTDGIGNAFRHALWCCLILMYCSKISSAAKSLRFCKRITDLYEEMFPNEPLQTRMDLHNNAVGMNCFMELLPGIHRQFFETGFFIDLLLEKSKTAVLMTNEDQWPSNELVYIGR